MFFMLFIAHLYYFMTLCNVIANFTCY